MATPKKPAAKAAAPKKAVAASTSKQPVASKGTVAKTAEKAAPAKAAAAPKAPAKKAAAPVKAAPAPAPKKAVAAPAPAPAKKVAAPVAKKAAAPAVKAAEAPKPVAKKAVAEPAVKAAPAPAPKAEKPKVEKAEAVAAPAPTPKPSKADQRAAAKRTQSAVQRVQAKVAAAIPKPQPKPAPMPTLVPGRDEKKSNVIVAHRRLESNRSKPEEDNSMTMINYQPEFTRSILDKEEKDTTPLYRYSDEELTEFKELISGRLATARKELAYQQGLITHKDATGTDDTENRYMNMEDGSGAMEREQLAQLASRQIQFINHLEKAMVRIENKTYGICRVTGKLIDKARLRAVPHATLSIEAKNMMNK